MGAWISAIRNKFLQLDARVLMLGLDAAGKSTVLYKLKLGETIVTAPTIGFNCEQVQYGSVTFTMWDIGGQDKIRRLWNYYYQNTDALIFVVDSADRDRLDVAREELQRLLESEELRAAKLLVYCNKQDLPHALSPGEVAKGLQLDRAQYSHREWHVQGCCATTGDGLFEGLDWVTRALTKK